MLQPAGVRVKAVAGMATSSAAKPSTWLPGTPSSDSGCGSPLCQWGKNSDRAVSGHGSENFPCASAWIGAYEVDCLIFGSGFEVGTKLARQGQFEAYGRDGVSTSEAWGTGRRTLHGLLSHDFPNWFHVGLRQTGASLSLTYTYDTQVLHIAYLVAEGLARNAEAIEATAEAERAWIDLVNQPGPLQEYQKRCTPGFWNSEGKLDGNGFFDELYPDGPVRFREMLEELRNRGDFEGLTIARASD